MKKAEVEAILRFYKDIDIDIDVTVKWLRQYESAYDSRSSISLDGMPHGSTISNKTAKIAISIAATDTKEAIESLRKRLNELKKIRTEILREISALKPIHKAIIYGFYIKGQKWEQIAEQINYSVRQSKNIRCVALGVLGAKIARNRTISRSKIMAEII